MSQTEKILFAGENGERTPGEIRSLLLNGILVIVPQPQIRSLGSGEDFPYLWSFDSMSKV